LPHPDRQKKRNISAIATGKFLPNVPK